MDDLADLKAHYDSSVFNVDSIERAKWIILNPDGVHEPEERWKIETAYILDILEAFIPFKNRSCLDYGCGIGRLARPLIEDKDWAVIGADISPSMRAHAVSYVNSPRFVACDPQAIDQLLMFNISFDCALAVWSLQHCKDVLSDIMRIKSALNVGGRFFVLNAYERYVPTREIPWVNDGVNIVEILNNHFNTVYMTDVNKSIIPIPRAFWGVFEKF